MKFASQQVVTFNPAAANVPAGVSAITSYGADGSPVGYSLIAFGGGTNWNSTRFNGTASSPTALAGGNPIMFFNAVGYDGSATATGADLRLLTNGTWSGSNHGAFWDFRAVANGSTTLTEAFQIYGNYVASLVPLSLSSNLYKSFVDSISAAGTTQATATALTADVNFVTTVAASSGVVLPAYNATFAGTTKIEVFNEGANTLKVYPPSGASIKSGTTTNAANAPVTLTSGGKATFYAASASFYRQAA